QVVAGGQKLPIPNDNGTDGNLASCGGRLGLRQGGPHPLLILRQRGRQVCPAAYMHVSGSPSCSCVRNDCPQPHVRTALGLLMANPPPISVSTQSTWVPSSSRMLNGSTIMRMPCCS